MVVLFIYKSNSIDLARDPLVQKTYFHFLDYIDGCHTSPNIGAHALARQKGVETPNRKSDNDRTFAMDDPFSKRTSFENRTQA